MRKDNNNFLYLILITCYIYLFNKFINFNYEIIIIYFITLFIGYLFLNKYIIYCNLFLLIIYEIFFVNIEGKTTLAKDSTKGLDKRDETAEKGVDDFEEISKEKEENAKDKGAAKGILGGKDPEKTDENTAKNMEKNGVGDDFVNQVP